MTSDDQIQAWFGQKPISRAEVLSWEVKRATRGLRKLGVPVPDGDAASLRRALAGAKLAMGRAAMEQRLARDIRLADRVTGALVRASRGHRRLCHDPRGQEVWETTGGSPFASRFFFELDATEGLVTPPDATYPIQMAGSARLADGTVLGGIRHQFRDENGGTRAL